MELNSVTLETLRVLVEVLDHAEQLLAEQILEAGPLEDGITGFGHILQIVLQLFGYLLLLEPRKTLQNL